MIQTYFYQTSIYLKLFPEERFNSLHPQFRQFDFPDKEEIKLFLSISFQKFFIFVFNMYYFSIEGKQSGKVLDASMSNIGKK